jgi:hypothetical protein
MHPARESSTIDRSGLQEEVYDRAWSRHIPHLEAVDGPVETGL